MTKEQLEQLSQEELLKLFIEKSNQVQDLQARLTIAEAQLTSLGLIQEHILNANSVQLNDSIREKLEQLSQTQADLVALLSQSGESEAEVIPDKETE